MKAWRCRACDHWLHKAVKAAAVKYNPNANNGCDYYEGGKCTIDFPDTIHDNCDLEPVTITLLADYEAQQAALAAADKMLAVFQDIGEQLALPIEWNYGEECIAVATEVAAAREAIAKLNEEAE